MLTYHTLLTDCYVNEYLLTPSLTLTTLENVFRSGKRPWSQIAMTFCPWLPMKFWLPLLDLCGNRVRYWRGH